MARRLEMHDWDDLPGTQQSGADWALVLGNSIEVLERLPPRSVDLVFADPPYHLSNGGTTCQAGRRVRVDKGAWDQSRGVEADHAFQREWLAACRRVLKPSGTIWVSGTQHVIFSVGYAMQELGFHLLNTVTWYKPNAAPNLACRFFTHSTEILLWAAPMRTKPLAHRFNYRDMKERNGGKQMRDLTQKPLALLERVIAASTKEGDLVLDPFTGSGTTGVAAVTSGRRFLGVEMSGEYLGLAARRLRAVDEAAAPVAASG
jgi:site-specific DNA-methyltransferase (adenine-specific)